MTHILWMQTLWVALGGALGSVARFWVGLLMAPLSRNFPLGTLSINVVGSFIIAFFAVLTLMNSRFPMPEHIRLFVMVGICGGFTTFSSFSLNTFELLINGAPLRAFMNIVLSVVLCLIATAIGYYAAQAINTH
ncbi:fluoride efflux transporter CrcB [Bartonella sp. HY406]|nr:MULTISPECIES: fluoride efflux transporter CrcB [unclassified Bartonella]UXN03898.1 fluoride efflux transporter CrcB [Bartonella sp. HY406]